MSTRQPTFIRLGQETATPFLRFLNELEAHGDREFFSPHNFDGQTVQALVAASEAGLDEYWLLVSDDIIGYGMLRGWSEGFAIPSLGIAVGPRYRGQGVARLLMEHLHSRSLARGSSHVRLKVDRRNVHAQRLYQRLGYVFQDFSVTELLGVLDLREATTEAASPASSPGSS